MFGKGEERPVPGCAGLSSRYFGSKEQLFAEVLVAIMAHPVLLAPHSISSRHPSEPMARARHHAPWGYAARRLLIMLRSAGSELAAEIGREQIEAHYQTTLSRAWRGDDAQVRAALILSLVAGLQMMRQALALPALAQPSRPRSSVGSSEFCGRSSSLPARAVRRPRG